MTFLNKYQVAERLQVTTRTIDKWIKEGYFPKGRYGECLKFCVCPKFIT